MSYQFIEVSSKEQLEKVFAFRYAILNEREDTRILLKDCKEERETDAYDAYAVHFAAFDENEQIIAYTRLIHHSPIGYPTTNHMKYDTDSWQFDPEFLGEFSRIFVAQSMRSIENLKLLFNTLKTIGYKKMISLNIAYTLGTLEKPFFRLLHILHFPYHRIGELQTHYGQRYPCILYTDELRTSNTELFDESVK